MSKKKKQISGPQKKVSLHPVPTLQTLNQKLRRVLTILVALVAVAEYFQTISYDFTLDDYSAIVENKVTTSGIEALPVIFKTTYRFGYPIQGDELYRPVPKAIFAILWQAAPGNSMPGHMLNILLYAITGALLFTILLKFFPQNIYVPFIASLLFIAHPVHTEVVASIKSLDEILSFLFFLLSVYCLQKFIDTGKSVWMISSVAGYFISLFSKESSITFLALYPLLLFFFTNLSTGKIFRISAWMLLPAFIFLIVRYRVTGAGTAPDMADNMLFATNDILVRKVTAIYILGLYLKLLLFPSSLSFDYSYNQIPLISLSDWRFWVTAIVLIALFGYAVSRLKKKDPVAFGIFFFLITISVSSNLFIYIGTHMAERLLYVPAFGFCFSVAAIAGGFIQQKQNPAEVSAKEFFKSQPLLITLSGIVVLIYSIKTWIQNPVWKNNKQLYESGIIQSPDSHRTHFYLGNLLVKKSYYAQFPEGEQQQIISRGLSELRKSAAIYPKFADAWLHIGNYYTDVHQADSAAFYFRKTLDLEPYLATAHNNLGTVYFEEKKINEAIAEFTLAIQNDPNYHDAYRNLGSAYGTIGKYQEAVFYFTQALNIAPEDAETNYYLGITYRNMGDASNAKVFLNKAAQLNPELGK